MTDRKRIDASFARDLVATPSSGKVHIVVGLDFGTSTTKVVLASRTERQSDFTRRALKVFGHALLPSIIEDTGSLVTFGVTTPPRRGTTVHRSLKMRFRDAALAGRDATKEKLSTGLDLEAAIFGYLASVANDVEATIDREFPESRFERKIEWHLGVPADQECRALQSFADTFFRAVRSANLVRRTMTHAELSAAAAEARRKWPRCPDERSSKCDCFVRPEAAVAVNTLFLLKGSLENGTYFVCDIGAGTIDTAFFRFYDAADDMKPIKLYGTSCVRCGGDDFVKKLIPPNHTDEDWRKAEAFVKSGGVPAKDPRIQGLLGTLLEARRTAYREALTVEKPSRWTEVAGFVIGGAASIGGVREKCLEGLPTPRPDVKLRVIERPLKLTKLVPDATDLHGIAVGLSVPIHEFKDHESGIGEVENDVEDSKYDIFNPPYEDLQ